MDCGEIYQRNDIALEEKAPICLKNNCNGLLKPDFIFFGEGIPTEAYQESINAANNAEVFILIGTTGEIMPASQIPHLAKQNGAKIVEINIEESNFTQSITDVFIRAKATEAMSELLGLV
jgi:NAD-dependent deacetylase